MHRDEVRATSGQVRRLLRSQCPQWADLVVQPLPDEVEGTDPVLFRIGDQFVARMPKIAHLAAFARALRGVDPRDRPVKPPEPGDRP